MENIADGVFFNPTQGNLTLDEVMEELVKYIKKNPEKLYEVIVGCDSSSGETPDFPLVVAILRTGEGGRFFLKKVSYGKRIFHRWKERILQEVLLSCQFAVNLKEELAIKLAGLNYEFRYIHADIGANGQTKDMIKELTGLIIGNGFEPKIKPESFVASSVADRYS
ncbi:MAG: ribonuclease H-like YkuK family protein [bacterium]|nr:ribonuclease H-like YkuK family protein [bacterium]